MSDVSAIARGATALNLALTGITVDEVSTAAEGEARVDALMQDGSDILIIEEALRDEFSDRMRDRLQKHSGQPLLVYCPGFEDEDSDVDAYLSAVIKPAVGFEIRLG